MASPTEILQGKILIVDNLEANIVLLDRTLRGAGYTGVTSTTHPREVCDLHRKNGYQLILLDLEMPGFDGFQVMEGLKSIEVEGYVSVLAITAQPAHKLRALKSGAKDFISKPFDLAEVLMRVHNLLEVRLLHEAAREHGKILASLALNDPLTGLANRRLLADRMAMALLHARRNKVPMAVVYLDLDGFKGINDALGHGVGDELLKRVGLRLVQAVREEDTVARLGGDEFCVVLATVNDVDDVAKVAAKLIEVGIAPYEIEGHAIHVTVSAGVSVYPAHGKDMETLLKSADGALYGAKRKGKNAFQISGSPDVFANEGHLTDMTKVHTLLSGEETNPGSIISQVPPCQGQW